MILVTFFGENILIKKEIRFEKIKDAENHVKNLGFMEEEQEDDIKIFQKGSDYATIEKEI